MNAQRRTLSVVGGAILALGVALPLGVPFVAQAQSTGAAASASAAKPKGSASAAPAAKGSATPAASGSAAPAASGSAAPASAGGDGGVSGAAAGATAPSAGAAGATMDGSTYAVKLRNLEQRVDELKDQIRRSHTRLALLSDILLSGGAAGSRAEVSFQNEMSNAFKLVRALIVIDGAVQYRKEDESGALADQKEIPVFSGSIPPGDHTVQVVLQFQGNGYGVFTYLRGYKFEVKSSHAFTAVEGKSLTVTAIALEKGGVTTPLEQRPTIEWKEKLGGLGSATAAPAAGKGPSASGNVQTGPGSASGGFSVGTGK